MRILQINNYHFLKGGSERVCLETSRCLEEHGHKVIHFSVNDAEALESPYKKYFVEPADYFDGGFVRKVINAGKFIYSREAKEKLERLIQNEKPDIAHLHIFYGRLTSAILPVLKSHNIPVVMTVHEYRMLCPAYLFMDNKGEICERCANSNYFYCILKRCNKGSLSYSMVSALECYIRDRFFSYEKYVDRFIMVSEFIRDKHLGYKKALKGKTEHIYNFIDCNSFSPDRIDLIGGGKAGEHYLYAGRLSQEKGLMTLLMAWRHFRMTLKIAGKGPLKDEISRYVLENRMENVELLGHLSGEALTGVMKKSRYLILPSECYENNPMVVLEASAVGLPTIGSKIGGIPELVKDGINGFLFESKNVGSLVAAIERAEGITKDQYVNISREARKYVVERFSRDQYYEKLMGVYRDVRAVSNNAPDYCSS